VRDQSSDQPLDDNQPAKPDEAPSAGPEIHEDDDAAPLGDVVTYGATLPRREASSGGEDIPPEAMLTGHATAPGGPSGAETGMPAPEAPEVERAPSPDVALGARAPVVGDPAREAPQTPPLSGQGRPRGPAGNGPGSPRGRRGGSLGCLSATLAGLAGLVGAIIIVLGVLYLLNGTLIFASGPSVAAMATSAASGQQIDDGLETQVEALLDRAATEQPQATALARQVQALATRAADDDALATRVGRLSGQLTALERSSATQQAQLAWARNDLATSEAIGARNRARLGVLDKMLGSFRDALLTAEPLPTPAATPTPSPTFTPAATVRPPAIPANPAASPSSPNSWSVSGRTSTPMAPTSPVATRGYSSSGAGTPTRTPLPRGPSPVPTFMATATPAPHASARPSPLPVPTPTAQPSQAPMPPGEL